MNCDQIRPMLTEYLARSLPPFKAAWVSQHLACCQECQALATELQPAPVASATEASVPRHDQHQPGSGSRWTPARRAAATQRRPGTAAAAGTAPAVHGRRPARRRRVLTLLLAAALLAAGALAALRAVPPETRSGWIKQWLPQPQAQEQASQADEPPPAVRQYAQQYSQQYPQQATEPPAAPASLQLPFTATAQEQAGITLTVSAIVRRGGQLLVTARFSGQHLSPPANQDWVTVLDELRRPLKAQVQATEYTPDALSVEVQFELPENQRNFALRLAPVTQQDVRKWFVALPMPPAKMEQPGRKLPGEPQGLVLTRYGTTGDQTVIQVSPPLNSRPDSIPTLYLQDGAEHSFRPTSQQMAGSEIQFRYALPEKITPPLALIGDVVTHTNIGPWLVEATLSPQ